MKRLLTVLLFVSLAISQAPMLAMNSGNEEHKFNEDDNKPEFKPLSKEEFDKLPEEEKSEQIQQAKILLNKDEKIKTEKIIKQEEKSLEIRQHQHQLSLGLSHDIWQKIFSFLFSQNNQQPFKGDQENTRALSVLLKTDNQFNKIVWTMFTNTRNNHMAPLLNHFLANWIRNKMRDVIDSILINQTLSGLINEDNANCLWEWACKAGDKTFIESLLANTTILSLINENNANCLWEWACNKGDNILVRTLLANTRILGLIDADAANNTLYVACKNCYNTIVAILLANTTILGLINAKGVNNALKFPCKKGYKTILQIMLANTTILGLINANGANQALDKARKYGHNTIVLALLANTTILGLITNADKQTTLNWAKKTLKGAEDDQIDNLENIIEILEPNN